MAEPVLVVEKSEGIATLTLNRPAARNALSRELRTAIADAFAELARDSASRVAILTGAGGAFCAGLDLKEFIEIEAIVAKREPGFGCGTKHERRHHCDKQRDEVLHEQGAARSCHRRKIRW
jgi:enoyl-CoA hydratase